MSANRCPGPCHAELITGRSCRSGECLKDPTPQMRALYERMKELTKDVIFVTGRSQGKSVAIDTEIYNHYVITDFSKIDLSLDS